MSRTWRKKTTLAVSWAQKVRIYPTIRRIPKLDDFRRTTAVHWNIPLAEVTPEMMKAHLRHSCTNYEARIVELGAIDREHRLSPQDRYVARHLLKLAAIDVAEKIFSKIVRQQHCEEEMATASQ